MKNVTHRGGMSPSGSNQQLLVHGGAPTRAETVLRAGRGPKPVLPLRGVTLEQGK